MSEPKRKLTEEEQDAMVAEYVDPEYEKQRQEEVIRVKLGEKYQRKKSKRDQCRHVIALSHRSKFDIRHVHARCDQWHDIEIEGYPVIPACPHCQEIRAKNWKDQYIEAHKDVHRRELELHVYEANNVQAIREMTKHLDLADSQFISIMMPDGTRHLTFESSPECEIGYVLTRGAIEAIDWKAVSCNPALIGSRTNTISGKLGKSSSAPKEPIPEENKLTITIPLIDSPAIPIYEQRIIFKRIRETITIENNPLDSEEAQRVFNSVWDKVQAEFRRIDPSTCVGIAKMTVDKTTLDWVSSNKPDALAVRDGIVNKDINIPFPTHTLTRIAKETEFEWTKENLALQAKTYRDYHTQRARERQAL